MAHMYDVGGGPDDLIFPNNKCPNTGPANYRYACKHGDVQCIMNENRLVMASYKDPEWKESDKLACCRGEHTYKGKLDRRKCKDEWCPFSVGCGKTLETAKFCAEKAPGKNLPRIQTDINCRHWCIANDEACDNIKLDFCYKHPGHDACACINPTSDPKFQKFMANLDAVGIPKPTVPAQCWWSACADGANQHIMKTAKTAKAQNQCDGADLQICQQVVQQQKKADHNVVDSNTFHIQCNAPLPKHGSGATSSPTPKGHQDEDSDDDDDDDDDRLDKRGKPIEERITDFASGLTRNQKIAIAMAFGFVLLLLLLLLFL
jgi:hypothetical protein